MTLSLGCGMDAVPPEGEGETDGETEGTAPTASSPSASGGPTTPGTTGDDDSEAGTQAGEAGDDDSSGGGSSGGDDPPVDLEFDWYPCPTFTGGEGLEAECAEVAVPLDWAEPGGEEIELFVKRLGGSNGSHQLWMLNGGPGQSGVGDEGMANSLAANDGLDVYLLDHRGTGRSSRLTCTAEGPATPAGTSIGAEKFGPCIDELQEQWGEGLAQFNTTNAAWDLSTLIDEVLDEVGDQVVHVFGGSYGTYWAHRYLQVAPDQAAGVSMLGVASPGFDFRYWERDFNAAGERYLALCDDDPGCSARLGPDTVARAHDILDAVDAGQCAAAGLDRTTLNAFFAGLNAWSWYERVLTPAVLYRLERCNPADVTALQVAASAMGDPTTPLSTDPLTSAPLLGSNIIYGEMYKTPLPDADELDAIHADAIYSFGSGVGSLTAYDAWPRYEPDELVDVFAETDTPVLMIEGELDPNSPLPQAERLADALTAPNQRFYAIPGGIHNWGSPMVGGGDCAWSLFVDFINDPESAPTDCTGNVEPVSFANIPELAQQYFGTNDLWD